MSSSNKAWVTLATNDSYSLGALVLAHSLKTVNTAHKLAILITPGVTTSMRQQIEAVFDDVKVVDVLDSKDQSHLALMCRPELGVTFTKLHCWTLTKYEKCVFLDADTLVLQNCDELFEREELSAAPDPGWPDCFNSGVFVYKPSQDTFAELLEFARTRGSFDGGDQGLLNMFFKEWANTDISKHLSFTYNVVWSSTYSYLPALKQFGQNMKIVHFIASSKPWLQSFNTETRLVTATSGGAGLQALLQLWWDLFCHHVHPKLSTEMIESRLSSCYSYDSHPQIPSISTTPSNYNSNYTPSDYTSNTYAPTYEPPNEDHYNFVDPWEDYLISNEQKHYEVEEENVYVDQVENARDDGNVVEISLNNHDNHCERVVENNYYVNNCDMEDKTRDYGFQNNVNEKDIIFENEVKNSSGEVRGEFNEPKQEQNSISYESCPACFDEIPINLNSRLSVNNCRPESPMHCEVPKDQTHDSNSGLAGQFARISLEQKTADQKALEDFMRRQSWEQGNMDYLGKDSFSNIWAKINETLGKTSEVKIESDAVTTPPTPEIVHIEEPKPLKSALKKTSTTTAPVESELIDSSELPVKQLEKLDLSKDILKELKTPETPTITSPTPPTTPATQVQESPKPESIVSVEETTNTEVSTEKYFEPVEPESPKPDTTEPEKETPKIVESTKESTVEQLSPKLETAEPKEEITKVVDSIKESTVELESPKLEAIAPKEETLKLDISAETLEQNLPKTDSSQAKLDEPVKEISESTETTPTPQSSVDSSTPLVSNDPPVPPKRTNKGPSNVPKSDKPSEQK